MIAFLLTVCGVITLVILCTLAGAAYHERVAGARHRLAVLFMPARGTHPDPRESGPLNVLSDVPPAEIAARGWRRPRRVENEAAAGSAPDGGAGWPAAPESGDVPSGFYRSGIWQQYVAALREAGLSPERGQLAETPPEGYSLYGGLITVGAHPYPQAHQDSPLTAAERQALGDWPGLMSDEELWASRAPVPVAGGAPWPTAPQPAVTEPTYIPVGRHAAPPVYGEAPELAVDEAQRLTERMTP